MVDIPVWVLLGQRTGDNNQLLRLATELGLPFRTLDLRYNALRLAPPSVLGASLASLDTASRRLIRPPWPRLVLGIGHRSVPAALKIRELAGGDTRVVRLGNPRVEPRQVDLVITTPQYGVPDAPNVLRLPVGISTAAKLEPTPEESQWLDNLPRPHRLLLLGGDTFMWTLGASQVLPAVRNLGARSGSVIAVGSGRSRASMLDAVEAALAGSRHGFVRGRFPRYPVLIEDADEIYVTADSVAMISDAIASGKPVGLIEPAKSWSGRLFYGLENLGLKVPVRDVRRFWWGIRQRGLAGTVDEPVAGRLGVDPVAEAVSAIRRLL
ncbi:MAG: ELM1/GtrOC1 family putative glycosyltransferase [Sphingomicrobium sp.]